MMTDRDKAKATQLGVRDAFDFWLSQHDISFPEIVQDAIQAAVKQWLDAHGEEVIAALGKAK